MYKYIIVATNEGGIGLAVSLKYQNGIKATRETRLESTILTGNRPDGVHLTWPPAHALTWNSLANPQSENTTSRLVFRKHRFCSPRGNPRDHLRETSVFSPFSLFYFPFFRFSLAIRLFSISRNINGSYSSLVRIS